jgi:hypothetical protein
MSNEPIRTGLWEKDSDRGSYYSGKIEIGGREYWVNLYKNDRKETDSQPDLNLQLKPKESNGQRPQQRQVPQSAANPFADDDLNF